MSIERELDLALRQIETLPLDDTELHTLTLHMQSIPNANEMDFQMLVGQVLQKILWDRQKKGMGYNRSLLLSLLKKWECPLLSELSRAPRSSFFLGSGL